MNKKNSENVSKTKIICTIGPSCDQLEQMLKLIDAGMNVARVNFSHGEPEYHTQVIENLKEARKIRDVPLAIMLDTKGPEIRVTKIIDDEIKVSNNQKIKTS